MKRGAGFGAEVGLAPGQRSAWALILALAVSLFSVSAHAQNAPSSQAHAVPTSRASDKGLLLGVYFPNDPGVSWKDLAGDQLFSDITSDSQGLYLTFWISRIDGAVNVRTVEGLLVPRSRGFWRVGMRTVSTSNHVVVENDVWAVPVGAQRPPDEINSKADEMDQAQSVITYVGPQYLTYVEHSTGGGGGSDYIGPSTVSLDDIQNQNGLPLEKVLSPEAVAKYRRHAKKIDHMDRDPDPANGGCNCCEGQPTEWGLRHVNTSWQTYANFRFGVSSYCGQQSDEYVIDAPLPKSIAAGGSLPGSWDDQREQAADVMKVSPDIFDHLFVSPSRDFVVALTDNGIAVLAADGSRVTSVLHVEKFGSPCMPVMEQWATGKYVQNWDDAVGKERAAEIPSKPKL